jgi:hypothetical protein
VGHTGTWKVSLYVGTALGIFLSVYIARDQLQMPKNEAQTVNVWWHIGGWSWGGAAGAFIAAAYLGLITPVAGYVGAASMVLINALFCFVAIVFRRFF